jgi:hypothetical protein
VLPQLSVTLKLLTGGKASAQIYDIEVFAGQIKLGGVTSGV